MRTVIALLLCLPTAWAAKNMEVHFIDVEGGNATLIVSPSGESLLVDTGWPGFSARDPMRIIAAAKAAKVKKIDYVMISHFHRDHVGGALALSERIPVGTFLDHGKNIETDRGAQALNADYEKALAGSKHVVLKPGDKIPIKGLDVQVVVADGNRIDQALKGAGQPNSACAGVNPKSDDPSENARSAGIVVTFGNFRMVELGDLTWNKLLPLGCPNNLLGKVDVYRTTHHGLADSHPAPFIHALAAKVAVMNNGAKKGGDAAAWQVIKASPGLEDLWQLHFAVAGGKENNSPDTFIANIDENCEGKSIAMVVQPDGTYTVTNTRNKFTKTYKAQQK